MFPAGSGPVKEALVKKVKHLLREGDWQKAKEDLRPHVEDADRLLEATMIQVAQATGGECGPIEATAMRAAAWQTAYANYWMTKATEEGDQRLVLIASKLLDSARANMLAAYDIAVRVARTKPKENPDPVGGYIRDDDAL